MRCLCRLVRAFPAPCYPLLCLCDYFLFIWLVRASFSTFIVNFLSGDDFYLFYFFNGAQWLGVRVRGGGGATLGAWVMALADSCGSGMAQLWCISMAIYICLSLSYHQCYQIPSYLSIIIFLYISSFTHYCRRYSAVLF